MNKEGDIIVMLCMAQNFLDEMREAVERRNEAMRRLYWTVRNGGR